MALISNGDQVLTKNVYGTDETVLWEGAQGSCEARDNRRLTLSENINNFNRLRVISTYNGWNTPESRPTFEVEIDLTIPSLTGTVVGSDIILNTSSGDTHLISYMIEFTFNSNEILVSKPHRYRISGTNIQEHSTNISVGPVKVVGIGRKGGV